MEYIDQLNRKISVSKYPQRIISMVPSQTELLVDLGLEEKIVGVTKFCVHPSGLTKKKTIVGGTKNYRKKVIESLKPDLIIGNKEENEQFAIQELMGKYPVWMSDIYSIEDSLELIGKLGDMLGARAQANKIILQLESDFSEPLPAKGSAIYLIWNDPIMVAGKGTFINDMLCRAGFENLIHNSRYPQLIDMDLIAFNPEYLLLSSEPYPFKEKNIQYFKTLLPNTEIKLIDGQMFSWYGSRLLKAKSYFEFL